MIDLKNLGKSYGARTLFRGVSCKLIPGSRYGLVGANGSGKSTLLRILSGEETVSDGGFTVAKGMRLGVLQQDRFMNDADTILNVAMSGDELVMRALKEQEALIAEPMPDAERLAELEHQIAMHDGYTLESRTSQILEGLGIPTAAHRRPLSTLSGGFKLRVLLAQILAGNPDAMLLDEPTNHLDILSIRWLEKFLGGYRGCAVVISHDQRFLDNVATHVLDVDYGTVTLYVGNYAAFTREKQELRARKEAEISRTTAAIAEKRAWVERFGAKATKARQAQSRLKQIEKIEVEELESSSRQSPLFRFVQERPSGKEVLELKGLKKSYGEKRVLNDVSLLLRRKERLAVIGPNGLGKSTLLKIATGRLSPDQGEVRWGYEARVGYFAQDHHELLPDPRATPLRFLWDAIPTEGASVVRGHLGRMLFSGDEVEKPIGALSGGEAARLIFCRILVEKPNVLLLDEPTNHLDLEAIAALVEGLSAYEGTLLFVSHDRAFVSALATRILEVTEQGFRDFPGTYEEYLERSGDDHLDSEAVVLRAKKQRTSTEKPQARTLSWEEQKRRNNKKRQLPTQRDQLISAIEAAEARRAAIHAKWAEPGFYEATEKERIDALILEEQALAPRIEALLAEWAAIEAEIESLSKD